MDGLGDGDVEALFHKARAADYADLAREAKSLKGKPPPGEVARLGDRLAAIIAIDYFGAPDRKTADSAVGRLEKLVRRAAGPQDSRSRGGMRSRRRHGRTWVTRRGVFVDRIASAWLVKRFIDAEARFKFVAPEGYTPAKGEIRFDMFEAEYTHEGDRCTFETLVRRFRLRDPALRTIGEIVHDIDCKDMKFGRAESPGVERLLAGIARKYAVDATRLQRGAAVFDNLYQSFARAPQPRTRRRATP